MAVRTVSWAAVVASVSMAPMALAVDWSTVPGKDIVLFYPGQLSWEMLLTQAEHSGADKFREGKDCRQCHEGEEVASGKLLVADKSAEKEPIAGKPGSITANVKAAYDAENILIHVEFKPGEQPDAGMEKDFAHKVAVMIDDGKLAEVTRGGCWAVCHDNLARMPSAPGGDTTKYVARSRVKVGRGGGAEIKPEADIAKYLADGAFLEYWQARLNANAAPVVADGWVLDKRHENPAATVTATSSVTGDTWAVTFSRKLAGSSVHKAIVPGTTYTVGFAVHAGHTAQRFHYVSLEKTLVLGQGKADFVAVRQ
ncbi:MAG: ethylbenzene dehydrogenase-related protein [Rhodospirillaceae bacterium]|nr:ethylbenzene dehydrogenase-related protein [Rhodospirillaceae bacterium]